MEVGHDSWLTETGYVVLFWGERQWGTSTALPVKDFRRPTEDVSLDLYCWGLFFLFLACGRPARRIFFFAPEWETVNGIWRVRRSIEQVVQCFVSWSGGDGEDTGVASPSVLGICGQGGIQLMVITSSQPAVFFCREPSSALLSLSSSLFPSLPHSQHLASRCL